VRSGSRPDRYISGEKINQYQLDRKLDIPESRSVRGGEEEEPSPYWESKPGRSVRSLVTILTELRQQLLILRLISPLIKTDCCGGYMYQLCYVDEQLLKRHRHVHNAVRTGSAGIHC